MTENDFEHVLTAYEDRHGDMPKADLDRLMIDLEAHVEEVVGTFSVVEVEHGEFVIRVPDLLPVMRQFVAGRLGGLA